MQRKPSCATTKLMLFTVSKDRGAFQTLLDSYCCVTSRTQLTELVSVLFMYLLSSLLQFKIPVHTITFCQSRSHLALTNHLTGSCIEMYKFDDVDIHMHVCTKVRSRKIPRKVSQQFMGAKVSSVVTYCENLPNYYETSVMYFYPRDLLQGSTAVSFSKIPSVSI